MSLNVSLQVLAGRTEMHQLSCLCPPVLQDLCSRRKQREEENESRDGEGGVREACDTSMREREGERERGEDICIAVFPATVPASREQEKERETDGERCIGYAILSAPHFAESRRMLDERKQKRKNLSKENK